MPGSQNISAKWVGWVKCNSLRDRRAIQMSCIHELALLSLLSNFLWHICNCRPAELHLNCTRLRLSSTSIFTHSEPRTQNPELVAAAQTENARQTQERIGWIDGRKEGSPWPGWVFAPVVYFYSSLPCAWVHLSRKTMNTKRKSILQFFTVFRLKINWLKKLSTSTYLPSPTPGTHTHKYTPTHMHRGATPAGI